MSCVRTFLRTAPWWAIAIIYGIYFGLVMGVFFSFQDHHGWKVAAVSGAVAGTLFGAWMGATTTKRRDRATAIVGPISEDRLTEVYRSANKGPVPTDPEVREASSNLIEYRLAQAMKTRTSSYIVFGLFILLGIYLVIASGPIWWLSVALFAGLLVLTRWQSVRLSERAAVFGIDTTQLDVQSAPGLFDFGHMRGESKQPWSQFEPVLIKLRWWALAAGVVLAALAVLRTADAHGSHGIGEAALAVTLWGCSLWGFMRKSKIRR